MNRYEDNISPQPNNCNPSMSSFKTPTTAQAYSNSIFPTPPSENDDTSESSLNYGTNASYIQDYQQQYYNMKGVMNQPGLHVKPNESTPLSQNKIANSSEIQDIVDSAAASSTRFKRRCRTTFSKQQLDILEATFQKTHYPDVAIVDRLSSVLNLGTERISIWFQNRRAKHKKDRKSATEQSKTKKPELPEIVRPTSLQTTPETPYENSWRYYNPAMLSPQFAMKPMNYTNPMDFYQHPTPIFSSIDQLKKLNQKLTEESSLNTTSSTDSNNTSQQYQASPNTSMNNFNFFNTFHDPSQNLNNFYYANNCMPNYQYSYPSAQSQ